MAPGSRGLKEPGGSRLVGESWASLGRDELISSAPGLDGGNSVLLKKDAIKEKKAAKAIKERRRLLQLGTYKSLRRQARTEGEQRLLNELEGSRRLKAETKRACWTQAKGAKRL